MCGGSAVGVVAIHDLNGERRAGDRAGWEQNSPALVRSADAASLSPSARPVPSVTGRNQAIEWQ